MGLRINSLLLFGILAFVFFSAVASADSVTATAPATTNTILDVGQNTTFSTVISNGVGPFNVSLIDVGQGDAPYESFNVPADGTVTFDEFEPGYSDSYYVTVNDMGMTPPNIFSTSPTLITVNPALGTPSITSVATPIGAGQTETVIADTSSVAGTGSGTIAYNLLASSGAGYVSTDATCTPADPTVCTYMPAAGTYTYEVTATDQASTPATTTSAASASVTVSQATSTISVLCPPFTVGTPTTGSGTTCTALVTGYGTPGGTVSFVSSSGTGSFTGSGVCTLSSGACTVGYNDTTSGSPTITATYSGDTNNPGTSGITSVTVNPSSTGGGGGGGGIGNSGGGGGSTSVTTTPTTAPITSVQAVTTAPTTTAPAAPTTTAPAAPTTTAPAVPATTVTTNSSGASKVQQSVSQPLISPAILEIAACVIAAAVVAAFLYNKRRIAKRKAE